MITSLINFFILMFTTFLMGTAYFAIFFFWFMVMAYYFRKKGYLFEVQDINAQSFEKEKTEK